MIRIAHISNGQITNVSLAADGWMAPADGSQILESEALSAGMQRIAPVPVWSVSMRALRFSLFDAGLLDSVLAAIEAIPDAVERFRAQTWWLTAQTVESDHPLVAYLAAAVGQTDEQLNTLFAAAESLK